MKIYTILIGLFDSGKGYMMKIELQSKVMKSFMTKHILQSLLLAM